MTRRILCGTLLLIALCFTLQTVAQSKGNGPKGKNPKITVSISDDDAIDDTTAIIAFSDTTTVAGEEDSTAAVTSSSSSSTTYFYEFTEEDLKNLPAPFKFIMGLLGSAMGVGGAVLAIICLLIVFAILLSPILIILLVLWLINRNRNEKLKLAEQAIRNGQSYDTFMETTPKSQQLWEQGIRKVSIGIGLAILFWFLDFTSLIGIGFLVACYGGGQMFIAHQRKNKE